MKIALPIIAAALAAVSAPASATVFMVTGTLSGLNSVPANASTASGSYTVTLDDVANSVAVSLTFTGLTTPASAAHIHCCVSTTANGPVVLPFAGFPTTTSGSYSNTFAGVSLANINGIKNGLAYINIHNATFPGGEIRGNIAAVGTVPEAATWGMMIVGFGMVGGAMRSRRSRPITA